MKFKTQYSGTTKKTREVSWWSTDVDKETGEVKKVLKKQDIDIRYEYNNLPSLTIPDQSMSVTDLIKRFQQGLTLTDAKVPIYYGDEEYPDLRRMDISEKYEYLERTKLTVKELQDKFKAQQREAAQKAKDAQRVPVHHDEQGDADDNNQNPKSAKYRQAGRRPSPSGNERDRNNRKTQSSDDDE